MYFNHQESGQSDSIALLESDARDAEEEEVITVEMIDDNIEKTPDTAGDDDTSPDTDTAPLSSSSSDHHHGHSDKTKGGSETKLFLRRLVGVRDEVSQYIHYLWCDVSWDGQEVWMAAYSLLEMILWQSNFRTLTAVFVSADVRGKYRVFPDY